MERFSLGCARYSFEVSESAEWAELQLEGAGEEGRGLMAWGEGRGDEETWDGVREIFLSVMW